MRTKRLLLLTASFAVVALLASPVLAAVLWDALAGIQKPVKAAICPTETNTDDPAAYGEDSGDMGARAELAVECLIARAYAADKAKYPSADYETGQGIKSLALYLDVVSEAMQLSSSAWVKPLELALKVRPRFRELGISFPKPGIRILEPSAVTMESPISMLVRTADYMPTWTGQSNYGYSTDDRVDPSRFVRVEYSSNASSVPEPGTMLGACALLAPAAMIFSKRKFRR